jgi:hypothetical protein
MHLKPNGSQSSYRSLDAEKVVATVSRLRDRIGERFPGSGLSRVSEELLAVAKESVSRSAWIGKPLLGVRIGVAALVLLLVLVLGAALLSLRMPSSTLDLGAFVQIMESGINDIVLMGAGIYFLVTLESRIKRKVVIKAVHELRALAHIVDTHQLTKDPERLSRSGSDTASSPRFTMTPFELSRYLDYCAESLSLIGKIAALHVQRFDDSEALGAVDDIEDLTTGLSRKIWQKIALISRSNPLDAGG